MGTALPRQSAHLALGLSTEPPPRPFRLILRRGVLQPDVLQDLVDTVGGHGSPRKLTENTGEPAACPAPPTLSPSFTRACFTSRARPGSLRPARARGPPGRSTRDGGFPPFRRPPRGGRRAQSCAWAGGAHEAIKVDLDSRPLLAWQAGKISEVFSDHHPRRGTPLVTCGCTKATQGDCGGDSRRLWLCQTFGNLGVNVAVNPSGALCAHDLHRQALNQVSRLLPRPGRPRT